MLLISKPNEERFIWQIRIPVTFVFPALSSGILLLPKRKHWSLFIVRLKPAEQLSPTLSPAGDESVLERKKLPPSHVWMPPRCLKSSFSRIRCSKTRLLCPLQLSKTNTQYHKLFKDVSRDELLIKSRYRIQIMSHNVGEKWICWAANLDVCVKGYTCALQRDILYQGKMFVSDNWICFHSKVFGRDTKVRSLAQLRLGCGPTSSSWHFNVSKSPDFHPRAVCDVHQENQNCAAGAERPRDRDGQLSGKNSAQVIPRISGRREFNSADLLLFFLSACVRVLPVSKHYVQISEVCLLSFGGICLPKCSISTELMVLPSVSSRCSAAFSATDIPPVLKANYFWHSLKTFFICSSVWPQSAWLSCIETKSQSEQEEKASDALSVLK